MTDTWSRECGSAESTVVESTKDEGAYVVSERVGRMWKGQLPRFDETCWGDEYDAGEKVSSSPRNP